MPAPFEASRTSEESKQRETWLASQSDKDLQQMLVNAKATSAEELARYDAMCKKYSFLDALLGHHPQAMANTPMGRTIDECYSASLSIRDELRRRGVLAPEEPLQ